MVDRVMLRSYGAFVAAGLLTWAAAAAWASPAAAQQPFARRLGVGIFAGFQGFADNSGLGNAFYADDVPQAGPAFGLRLSFPIIEQLDIEAEGGVTLSELPHDPVKSAQVLGIRGFLRYRFLSGDFQPYLAAGFGQSILLATKYHAGTTQASVKSPDVDSTYLVGVGGEYRVSYRGSVRLDLRWVGGDQRPGTDGLANGYEGLFGFTYAIGGPGEDRDNDGVADEQDKCPDQAEDKDGFEDADGCAELDNDGDGVPDSADKCQGELEDKDGFQDDDGCPDNDNDGDGVPDGSDKCKDKAEDKDGFQDQDGCPDPDNDGDGVLDAQDKCKDKAEDKDGFEDADGCPEDDNDGDGFADKQDKCPNEAETKNGFQDEDGCADNLPADVLPLLSGPVREIKWKGAKLDKKSLLPLEKLLVMLHDQEAIKLEVHVHTANKKPDAEKKVAEARAAAIVAFFVEGGIDAGRIISYPHGAEQPLSQGKDKKALAENERVEFRIHAGRSSR